MSRTRTFYRLQVILLALTLLVVPVACRPAWEVTLSRPDGSLFTVDAQVLKGLEDFAAEVGGERGVPLERVLVGAGHYVVDGLVVFDDEGARREFDWATVADHAWWLGDGRLSIDGQVFPVSRVEVEPPALLGRVQASITDIAPTTAAALGLPAPARATGQALDVPEARRVALIFLDGFGYVRYTEALRDGLIPNLAGMGEPMVGLTTYPPITTVSTASLLTGAPPEVHGIDRRGIRKTEMETLLDVAAAAGLQVRAVEGESTSFALRSADMQLSGDRDGNGTTDDNVLANALAVLDDGVPDVFFVHFHGIDDAGHTYGPGAPEECDRVRDVDAAVGQIVEVLPSDTLIVIFADHGMHWVNEAGRLGNHEHLIERDMFIPVFVISK